MANVQGQQQLSYLDNSAIKNDIATTKDKLEKVDERFTQITDEAQQQVFILSSKNTGPYPSPDDSDRESDLKLQSSKQLRKECEMRRAAFPVKVDELDECRIEAEAGTAKFQSELQSLTKLDQSQLIQNLPDDILLSMAEILAHSGQALKHFRELSPKTWKLLMNTTSKYMHSQAGGPQDPLDIEPSGGGLGRYMDEDSPGMDDVEVAASSPTAAQAKAQQRRRDQDSDNESAVSDSQPTDRDLAVAHEILGRHKATAQAQEEVARAQREALAKIVYLEKQLQEKKAEHEKIDSSFVSDLLKARDRVDALESELRTTRKDRENFRIRCQGLEAEMDQARENDRELRESVDQEKTQVLVTLQAKQTEIADLRQSVTRFEGQATRLLLLEKEFETLKVSERSSRDAEETLRKRLEHKTAEVSAAEQARDAAKQSADAYESQLGRAREDFTHMKDTSEKVALNFANERLLTKQVLDDIKVEKYQSAKIGQRAKSLESELKAAKAEAAEAGAAVERLGLELQASKTEVENVKDRAKSLEADLAYILERTLPLGPSLDKERWLREVSMLRLDKEVVAQAAIGPDAVWQVVPCWAGREPNYKDEFDSHPGMDRNFEAELLGLYVQFSRSHEMLTLPELNAALRSMTSLVRSLASMQSCKVASVDRILCECVAMLMARSDSRPKYQHAVLLGLKFAVDMLHCRWASGEDGPLLQSRMLIDNKLSSGDVPQSIVEIARVSIGPLVLSSANGLPLKSSGGDARSWMFLGDKAQKMAPFITVDLSARIVRLVSVSRLVIRDLGRLLMINSSNRGEEALKWEVSSKQYAWVKENLYRI